VARTLPWRRNVKDEGHLDCVDRCLTCDSFTSMLVTTTRNVPSCQSSTTASCLIIEAYRVDRHFVQISGEKCNYWTYDSSEPLVLCDNCLHSCGSSRLLTKIILWWNNHLKVNSKLPQGMHDEIVCPLVFSYRVSSWLAAPIVLDKHRVRWPTSALVLLTVGPKCTLAASHAVLWLSQGKRAD